MFVTRTISGAVLVAVTILLCILGGPYLAIASMLLSLIGIREFFQASGIAGKPIRLIECITYIAAVGYYLILAFRQTELILPSLAAALLLLLITSVIRYPAVSKQELETAAFGFFYVAFLFSFLYLTRIRANGRIEVWLIFFSAWGADTCAYLAGRFFGRHAMAPVLSPKKTWEGAIGGVLGAALLGTIYAAIMKQNILLYLLICAVGAVVSIFGDLAASAIKRHMQIKDFGHWIPGHGGFLDRYDSVLFTAPFAYLMLQLFLK